MRNVECQLRKTAFLQLFAVENATHHQFTVVGDILGWNDPWPQCAGFAEGLTHAVLVRVELPVTNTRVVEAGVTRNMIHGIGRIDVRPSFTDDNGQLGLEIELL